MNKSIKTTLALALMLGFASSAAAQDGAWPQRPVRMIAAAAPGGNPDVMGRLLADKLTAAFGKPFIVENVPGAGGVVAAVLVAKSAPDGHVLMLGDSGALAISPAMNPEIGYDPLKSFAPVTALATLPTILAIHPGVPAKTLDEFIALAKTQPGKMNFGSAGAGSIHHLTFAIFAEQAGIDLLHVPHRGGSAMVNGLLTGDIQAGFSGIPNVAELIAGGKLRGLCISTLQRSPSTPAIPTCDEQGLKGFNVATKMGMQVPAGTPPAIIARLQAELAKSMREPAIAARMTQLGMVMEENGTADYAAFIREDMARYGQAVKKLNLQVQK